MAKYSDSGGLVPNSERLDLSGIRPRNGEKAEDVAVQVHKDESDCSRGVGGALVLQRAGYDEQADSASTRGKHDCISAADLVYEEIRGS